MSTPRFLVQPDDLVGTHALLKGAELHHLRVRRLRIGRSLILTDGLGSERAGVIEHLNSRGAVIRLADEHIVEPGQHVELILAQAALRPSKLDLVVEKACELGASKIFVFQSSRTVAPLNASKQSRWQRVAQSAAKQCQRSTVPLVAGPVGLDDVLVLGNGSIGLFFDESAQEARLTEDMLSGPPQGVTVVVGPEGGFSSAESAQAKRNGFRLVGLGPRILRAETAAVVALTLCQFLWGDLGSAAAQRWSIRRIAQLAPPVRPQ